MNNLKKLFSKISKKERNLLMDILNKLVAGNHAGLDIIKVKDSDFFRLKKGRFRIIFHYYQKDIIIDSVKIRNEKTYKGN